MANKIPFAPSFWIPALNDICLHGNSGKLKNQKTYATVLNYRYKVMTQFCRITFPNSNFEEKLLRIKRKPELSWYSPMIRCEAELWKNVVCVLTILDERGYLPRIIEEPHPRYRIPLWFRCLFIESKIIMFSSMDELVGITQYIRDQQLINQKLLKAEANPFAQLRKKYIFTELFIDQCFALIGERDFQLCYNEMVRARMALTREWRLSKPRILK